MLANRGFALVFVVIVMTVLTTVGTIFISLNIQNLNINYNQVKYLSSYYISKAQLLHAIDRMRTKAELIFFNYDDANRFFDAYNAQILLDKIEPLAMDLHDSVFSIEVSIVERNENVIGYMVDVKAEIEEIYRRFQAYIDIEWNDKSLREAFKVINIREV